jgi:hypothetical protein
MVPRLNDALGDFVAMFRLWNQATQWTAPSMVLDFSRCNFVRHNGVAFLGGMIRSVERRGVSVEVDWATIHKPILRNLEQNGFAQTFGAETPPWRGNSIPYREDGKIAEEPIMRYLQEQWLGLRGVRVSQALGDAICGRVWEIYANAFEHSGSAVGIFTCGQLYPKREQLCLCVVDFGQGIPAKVANFRRSNRGAWTPSESLKWAFRPGTTTALTTQKSRGMGLDLLKDFVTVNGGQLSVYSGGARAVISKEHGDKFEDTVEAFNGTIVDIRLKCDQRFYMLASELPPSSEPYF